MSWSRLARCASLSILFTGAAACAEREAQVEDAPAKAPAPSPPPPPPPAGLSVGSTGDAEPTTIEEAERELERAVKELEVLYAQGGEARELASKDDDRCARACSAFASLERAAQGLCRLAPEDPRCERARALVDEHGARIAACAC